MSPVNMTEELAMMRGISERLAEVVRLYRVLAACRYLESGRASTWRQAIRMARTAQEDQR